MFAHLSFDYSGAKVLVTSGSTRIGEVIAQAYSEAGTGVISALKLRRDTAAQKQD